MAVGLLLPLRTLQAFLALMVLSFSGYVAHWYNTYTTDPSPSQVNFLALVPFFTFAAIAYLEITPRYARRASHPYIHLLIELVTCVLYLYGFIALAVFLARLKWCRGSVCGAVRADVGFAATNFVLWFATMTMLTRDLFKDVFKGGFRRVSQTSSTKLPPMKELA